MDMWGLCFPMASFVFCFVSRRMEEVGLAVHHLNPRLYEDEFFGIKFSETRKREGNKERERERKDLPWLEETTSIEDDDNKYNRWHQIPSDDCFITKQNFQSTTTTTRRTITTPTKE